MWRARRAIVISFHFVLVIITTESVHVHVSPPSTVYGIVLYILLLAEVLSQPFCLLL